MAPGRRAFRVLCYVLYGIGLAAAGLYAAFRLSPSFALSFNTGVGAVSRAVFTAVSDVFPMSLAELSVLAIPVLVVLLFIWTARRIRKYGFRGVIRPVASVLALICALGGAFALNGAAGYFQPRCTELMELDTSELTKDDLVFALQCIVGEINAADASGYVLTDGSGATKNEDSIYATSSYIAQLYEELSEQYPFVQKMRARPKILAASPLVTYLHISGVYCDYTGEININTNYPDYVVVMTIAHEEAHQRGVAREDEASLLGFVALATSRIPYYNYCACLDAYSTLGAALYKQDADAFREIRSNLCDTAKRDLDSYSAFFEKYRENAAEKVHSAAYDAYLKSQGTSGITSYDEVTELIVRYYKTLKNAQSPSGND